MSLRRLLNSSAAVSFVAFAVIFPLFFSARLRAQDTCSQSYIDSLPVPTPIPPAVKVVQLVNCTNQVILGAANAAHQPRQPGFPIFPREGTWVMQPYNSPGSVLTIDIPPQWTQTKCAVGVTDCPALGPNIWPRTGCRYDPVSNRAQCETGGCAGQYDCSSGAWGAPPFTSITEWTFIDKYSNNFDYPDISLVNGASINVDIEPVGDSDTNPKDRSDQHWLKFNYPLTVHGADLRTDANCPNSETGNKFLLRRSDIDKSGLYGYVIVDQNGLPTMPPGDNPLACLSNCGYYKFPVEEPMDCNARTGARCYAWKTFCAGDPSLYGKPCDSEQKCVDNNNGLDIHASCWNRQGGTGGTCELRGFYRNTEGMCNGGEQNGSPASKVACSFFYGSINPLSGQRNYADQPPTGQPPTNLLCKNVIGPDGKQVACIGDDTLHKVFHGAYTWPNDPEVFGGNAKLYRIIFAPGGTTAPITPAENGIPLCQDLPANYNYSDNYQPGVLKPCSAPVDYQGAVFAVANPKKGKIWACSLGQRGAGDEGVICRWHPDPADCSDYGTSTCVPCSPPITDTNVTASACGSISSGTSVKSSFITPSSNDPLFLEVTIPQVQNPVQTPTAVSGCASSWSLVQSQTINNNQGFVAWYKGVAANGQQCQVTMTLANGNPAALKVYDVPKFNGTVETTSTGSGNFVPNGAFGVVSAGMATTSNQNDLVLGNLLQVDQQYTPITYWVDWLTNSNPALNDVNCVNGYQNCPTDDATDFLPGHGPYSSNADAGHQVVGPGPHWLWRRGQGLTKFGWAGVAIYLQLNQ